MDYYLSLLISSILYIMPAYIANASAVLFRGKSRLDMGMNFFDGRPVLGTHKTVEGFLGGVIAGTVYGVIQYIFVPVVNPATSFLLALGAMTGDSIGSFIKRRLNLKSGELAPFLDQWDFVLGAFFLVYLGSLVTRDIVLPGLVSALLILVLTVVFDLLANIGAYIIGLKDVPW